MRMLVLRGVAKSYGRLNALHATDLEVCSGRTTVLIGPSGAGKSTLLRLMIGLVVPDSGEVYFDDTQLTPANVLSMRHRMGYCLQDGGLFPHLTARDNITLMARYLRGSPSDIEARLYELTELARFPHDALARFPVQLSGGQRQRVGLMRALMLDPDVLLLDEPLGALDPVIRAELQVGLQRIFQTVHKTVVLVTHDVGEALYVGDRVVMLRNGRIIYDGTPDQLLHCPSDPFVSKFINAQRPPLPAFQDLSACASISSPSR
jgi:osmoprotectant transport system ATP-binding protein